MFLVFFYLIKLLFSGFLPFKGNFVCGQNNSKYRDWAPLKWNIPFITMGFHRERTPFWYFVNYTSSVISTSLERITYSALLSLSFHTSPLRFGFVSPVKLGFSTRSYLSTSPPTPVSPLFIPVSSRLFLFPFQLLVAGALSLDVIASTTWRLGIFQQMSELVISKQARLKESNLKDN